MTATRLEPYQVEKAAAWLDGRVVETPMIRCEALDRLAGCRLWLKAENLQTGGSYKMRGAMLGIGRVVERGGRGVVAQSTGNHGIAVAKAAAVYGLAATIILPTDAVSSKIARVQAAGASVIFAGTTLDERLHAVDEVRARTGHEVMDAFDHPDVIVGQGTATLELLAQLERRGSALDALVVPVGGGGGVAGACLATAGSGISVYGAEPRGCDSMGRSLAAGERVTVEPEPTVADGLKPALVGRLPFNIAREFGLRALTVDERSIVRATWLALIEGKLLVEPSAAVALAGAIELSRRGRFSDIGVLLTGGNIEAGFLYQLAARHKSAEIGRTEIG
jgi:threonine dehydratase